MVEKTACRQACSSSGSIRKLVKKLGPVEPLRVCDEAGPTGYVGNHHHRHSMRVTLMP